MLWIRREWHIQSMKTKTTILYSSATDRAEPLARAAAEGAFEADGDVRLRRVPNWKGSAEVRVLQAEPTSTDETPTIPEGSWDDLAWADAIIFGTPTSLGLPAPELAKFLVDGPPRSLTDKVVSSFAWGTSTFGEREMGLTALNHALTRLGCIYVAPESASGELPLGELEMVRRQAGRTVSIARLLIAGRARA